MTNKRLYIKEDITDWQDEFNQIEPDIRTKEDLIKLRQTNLPPAQVGRLAIVSRAMGLADEDILSPNKELLNWGSAQEIASMMAKARQTIKLANGKEIIARKFVGHEMPDETEDLEAEPDNGNAPVDYSMVTSNSPAAIDRAARYLMSNVLGRVRERLVIVAQDKEAFKQTVKDFRQEFEAIVAEFG